METPGRRVWKALSDPNRPALAAVAGALESLWHWSSLVSVLAVVPVAHLLDRHGTGDPTGAVFGASFALFALLLPAVSILRTYFDARTGRLQEWIADNPSAEILNAQRKLFERLAKVTQPLQRGIVLAMLSTLASAVALIAPSTAWKSAPAWLVFSPAELLTSLALVCLVGSVAALFPFTWQLLIGHEALEAVSAAIDAEQQRRASQQGG